MTELEVALYDAQYTAARLQLMILALCYEVVEPGRAVTGWSESMLADIGVSAEIYKEALTEHKRMIGG